MSWEPLSFFGGNLKVQYCQDREILLCGGRGTGKSVAALNKLHLLMASVPYARGLIVRRTRQSITKSTLPVFENIILETDSDLFKYLTKRGGHKQYRERYIYPNKSEIEFGGLDKPGDFKSADYDIIIFEEAEQEKSLTTYLELVPCLRNNKLPYQQIICVCNPGSPHHWLYTRSHDKYRGELAMTYIQTSLKDNPLYWDQKKDCYTETGKSYIKPFASFPSHLYRRYFDGEWVAAEGSVYGEVWDPDVHIIEPFDTVQKEYRHIIGIDWGTAHVGVAQVWAISPTNIMYLVEEMYLPGKDVQWWFEEVLKLRDKYNIEAIIADSANLGNRQYFESRGIRTIKAIKNPVKDGISMVYSRLSRKILFFFRDARRHNPSVDLINHSLPTCTTEEIEGYVWQVDKEGKTIEEPVKKSDDGNDCMRYSVAHIDTANKFDFVVCGNDENDDNTNYVERFNKPIRMPTWREKMANLDFYFD